MKQNSSVFKGIYLFDQKYFFILQSKIKYHLSVYVYCAYFQIITMLVFFRIVLKISLIITS